MDILLATKNVNKHKEISKILSVCEDGLSFYLEFDWLIFINKETKF